MHNKKNKHNYASESSFPKSSPIYFCTPAQAVTLLAEGRSLLMFVRHGLTDWNMQMRLQGREEVPLNEEGNNQSKELAQLLKSTLLDTCHINGVYSSPLSRAKDTAQYIADALNMDCIVTEGLIERDYSSLSGLTIQQRREKFPSPKDYPTDIESVTAAAIRIKKTALDFCEKGKAISGATVAVTHGGVINSLFSHLTRGRAGVGKNVAKNCSISIAASCLTDIIPLAFNLQGKEFAEYIDSVLKN